MELVIDREAGAISVPHVVRHAAPAGIDLTKSAPTEPSDAEIVARARDGDHAAFSILVERYQTRAYRLALRILRDEQRAQDAVQEAFIKVYGALRRFEGRSSFYSWFYRLVYNHCLDLRRRDRSAREDAWDEERGAAAGEGAAESGTRGALGVPEARDPHRDAERTELREQLADAIDELSTDLKTTLLMREVDGLSYAEIAEAQDVPKGTVMSRLHNARRAVRRSLEAMGVGPERREGAES